jgi:hypothetical protein
MVTGLVVATLSSFLDAAQFAGRCLEQLLAHVIPTGARRSSIVVFSEYRRKLERSQAIIDGKDT